MNAKKCQAPEERIAFMDLSNCLPTVYERSDICVHLEIEEHAIRRFIVLKMKIQNETTGDIRFVASNRDDSVKAHSPIGADLASRERLYTRFNPPIEREMVIQAGQSYELCMCGFYRWSRLIFPARVFYVDSNSEITFRYDAWVNDATLPRPLIVLSNSVLWQPKYDLWQKIIMLPTIPFLIGSGIAILSFLSIIETMQGREFRDSMSVLWKNVSELFHW